MIQDCVKKEHMVNKSEVIMNFDIISKIILDRINQFFYLHLIPKSCNPLHILWRNWTEIIVSVQSCDTQLAQDTRNASGLFTSVKYEKAVSS